MGETLDEFRFGARCIRDLVRAWRVVNEQLPASKMTWEAFPEEDIPNETEAAAFLEIGLQTGLEMFHPTIIVERLEPEDYSVEVGTRLEKRMIGPMLAKPLYAVCCVELYNHIVEGSGSVDARTPGAAP